MQCNTTCKGDINVIELQGHTIALQDEVTQYVIMMLMHASFLNMF